MKEITLADTEIATARQELNKEIRAALPLTWWKRLWCKHERIKINLTEPKITQEGLIDDGSGFRVGICNRCGKEILLQNSIIDRVIDNRC